MSGDELNVMPGGRVVGRSGCLLDSTVVPGSSVETRYLVVAAGFPASIAVSPSMAVADACGAAPAFRVAAIG